MTSEELRLFKEEKPKYKIKTTGEVVDLSWLEKIISIYQERLKKLSEISELTDFFFKDVLEYEKELLKWGEMPDKEITDFLDKSDKILSEIKEGDWTKENIERVLTIEAEKVGDRGKLLWPLRVALCGKKSSASPFEIADILGKEKTLKRIGEARKKLKVKS
jgi:glutamyl/glutaminyl-tRNA synthetase